MRTQAIVITSAESPFKLKDIELDDKLRDDECHIRIRATGICRTDLKLAKEDTIPDLFPAVFGHEGAGIVQKVGSSITSFHPGDHVVVVYASCGLCSYCSDHLPSYCDLWFQHNLAAGRSDGSKAFRDLKTGARITSHFFGQSSFARDVYVKQTSLVKIVDQSIPFEFLAPLGCGLMTGAGAVLNVVKPMPEMSVAVIGAGSIGLAAVMALKLSETPRRIIAVDVLSKRLELAREFGATHGVNSKMRPNLMEVLLHITDGHGVDAAIDTTGDPEVVRNLIHSTARKGRVVTIGNSDSKAEVSINTFEMVQAGCSYIGCQLGDTLPQEFIPRLLEAYDDGRFPYRKLIKTYPVKDIGRAISDMEQGQTVKPVILWD